MKPHSLVGQAASSSAWDLQSFNRLVLAHQDLAFTFALHLLGAEEAAVAAVDLAFQSLFRQARAGTGFRLLLLRQVTRACLDRSSQLSGPAWLRGRLTGLSNLEKSVLVLVDCLQLSYADAAAVLDQPVSRVRELLARARRAVSAAPEAEGNGR